MASTTPLYSPRRLKPAEKRGRERPINHQLKLVAKTYRQNADRGELLSREALW
jgi:hypothetical protein